MNQLCCIVNPKRYTSEDTKKEEKCYCVHCHGTICELCANTYAFFHDSGTWYHHKLCRRGCTQDTKWHFDRGSQTGCIEHDVCLEKQNL